MKGYKVLFKEVKAKINMEKDLDKHKNAFSLKGTLVDKEDEKDFFKNIELGKQYKIVEV